MPNMSPAITQQANGVKPPSNFEELDKQLDKGIIFEAKYNFNGQKKDVVFFKQKVPDQGYFLTIQIQDGKGGGEDRHYEYSKLSENFFKTFENITALPL